MKFCEPKATSANTMRPSQTAIKCDYYVPLFLPKIGLDLPQQNRLYDVGYHQRAVSFYLAVALLHRKIHITYYTSLVFISSFLFLIFLLKLTFSFSKDFSFS